MKRIVRFLMLSVFFLSGAWRIEAQNSAFTFQGKLADAGSPANGQYDLQINLYDALTGGTLLGTLTLDNVVVNQGIFGVRLDYGTDVFTSNAGRYLEIGVRPGVSTGGFTTISPRQELTASPYSIEAGHANRAQTADNLAGLPPTSYLRSDTNQFFSGAKLTVGAASILDVQGSLYGNGANLTNLNAASITGGVFDNNRLPSNIARRNEENIFTKFVQFNVPPFASGEFITNLGANNIATGTLDDTRLSSNIPKLNTGNTFTAVNNNFTGRISAGSLSVGTGLPITKILTASATLDFGSNRILQQVLSISVPGARVGDAVQLGIPANLLPQKSFPAIPADSTPASVATEPYIFQGYVSSADTVSVTFMYNLYMNGDGEPSLVRQPPNCLDIIGFYPYCINPPAGVFRVVVFSFAP
ncbi:hypothetical protein BH10ACI2_BH10ACI2_24800 [soil metagenome]